MGNEGRAIEQSKAMEGLKGQGKGFVLGTGASGGLRGKMWLAEWEESAMSVAGSKQK